MQQYELNYLRVSSKSLTHTCMNVYLLLSSCLSFTQCRYQVSLVGVPIRNSLPSDSTRRPSGDGSPSRMHSGAVSAPNTMRNCSMDKTASKEESNLQILCLRCIGLFAFSLTILRSHLSTFITMIITAGKPAIGGEWSLIDLDGNLVTNRTFEGKWTLLYFGFARCPDICPSEMVKVGKVMDTLAEQHPELAKNLQPIFVSVDPARDSLKALKEYGKDFHPSYVFLTGSPEQVQKMAKKYRVYVSKADETEDGDYLVDHSIVIYFHDDQGDLADCFTQSMRPSDVVEKVVERMTFVPKY